MEEAKVVKKSLWLLHYTCGGSVMSIRPFYAIDEADVHVQVDAFLQETQLTILNHHLQAAPRGFTIHYSSLPGSVYERPDGVRLCVHKRPGVP